MAIPTSEETQTASSGLEWLLGGGGAFGTGAVYFIYDKIIKKFGDFDDKLSKIKVKQKILFDSIKGFDDYIKKDRDAFIEFSTEYNEFKGHTEEAIKRVDNAESNIDDFKVEIKAKAISLTERFGDLKTGTNIQEGRIADLEKKERKHYEELKDMNSDNRIMDREIQYLRNDMSDIKESLRQLTKVVTDMKEEIIKIATDRK